MTVAPTADLEERMTKASRQAVSAGAQRALHHISQKRWLAPQNRYRLQTIDSIKTDLAKSSINSRNLAEYVSVSAPLHCCDGWAYLGRAMACHLHGDSDSARHLAYYAELRASMSLLATQGIAILDQQHLFIDSNGSASLLWDRKKGTHLAAWEALEVWSQLDSTSDFLGEILRPAGQPMSQWINTMPDGGSWRPIATDWLLKLGLDLKLLSSDRSARNEASYRPTQLNRRNSLTSVEAAAAAREIWSLLEPSPFSFGVLDRHLLRLTIETGFKAVQGSSPAQSKRKFAGTVNAVVAGTLEGEDSVLWERFLKREIEPEEPDIIDLVRFKVNGADATPNIERDIKRPDHHLSVMARALLLLRLASGATRQMIIDAGICFDDLAFWWHDYGSNRGLWQRPPSAAEITDGWADIERHLSEVDEWINRIPKASYHNLFSDIPLAITGLTNLEIVGLWSLAR